MSARTPGGLVLLDGPGNGHPSASQRREQMLQMQLVKTEAAANHYLTLVAVLVMQQGGRVIIPHDAVEKSYELGFGKIAETGDLVYTAKPHAPRTLVVPPSSAAQEPPAS